MITSTRSELRLLAPLLLLAVGISYLSLAAPLLAIGAAAVATLLAFAVAFPGSVSRGFLPVLGGLLAGYALFGRTFAYLGAFPVYVGELVLALGVLSLALDRQRALLLRSPLVWLLLGFIVWGALRTIPYFTVYYSDALRDGVVWGYGAFGFLVAHHLLRHGAVQRVPERFARLLPWLLIWAPLAFVVARVTGAYIPLLPGTRVPILALKAGDVAVHLGGISAFLLLALHRGVRRSAAFRLLPEWVWWVIWLTGFLIMASFSRSAFLTAAIALLIAVLVHPAAGARRVAVLAAFVTAMGLFLFAFEVTVDLGGRRQISAEQIVANVQSIMGGAPRDGLEGSRTWRLDWWNSIVGYTLYGDYFWTGKGFGINLATADGVQAPDGTLRSPHNGHLTILARAGVPGLVLWILLQVCFAFSLIRAFFRSRARGDEWWARINIWILAYWAAFMVNGTFDVFLEGPQGGIWFWCLFGFGIAALEVQRRPVGTATTTEGPPGSRLRASAATGD